MTKSAQAPSPARPVTGADEPPAWQILPVLVVTVDRGAIVDVRVATRAFITAHLAAGLFTHDGGKTCSADAGPCPSSLD